MKYTLSSALAIVLLLGSATAKSAPIPLTLNQPVLDPSDSGYLTAPCLVSGNSSECFIDTGAGASYVTYEDNKHVVPIGGEEEGGVHGTVRMVDLIEVSDFQFGSLKYESHIFRRSPKGLVSRYNLIGNDFFWGRYLYFDFTSKELQIDEKYPDVEQRYRLLTFKKKWIGMYVNFSTERSIKALWDTGAGMTVVSQRLVSKYPERFRLVGQISVEDGTGEKRLSNIYESDIQIESKRFEKVRMISLDFATIQEKIDPDVDVIIGFNIYTQTNWLIDYQTLTWGFVGTAPLNR